LSRNEKNKLLSRKFLPCSRIPGFRVSLDETISRLTVWSSFFKSLAALFIERDSDAASTVDSTLKHKSICLHTSKLIMPLALFYNSRLYIRGSDDKLRLFRLDTAALIFDICASLAATSFVSRTDIKMITRNARLDAGESHARRQSEGDGFHFVQEIGSRRQIDNYSRPLLRHVLQKRPESVESFDSRLGIGKFIFSIQIVDGLDYIHCCGSSLFSCEIELRQLRTWYPIVILLNRIIIPERRCFRVHQVSSDGRTEDNLRN
jgi:hypothetical protein